MGRIVDEYSLSRTNRFEIHDSDVELAFSSRCLTMSIALWICNESFWKLSSMSLARIEKSTGKRTSLNKRQKRTRRKMKRKTKEEKKKNNKRMPLEAIYTWGSGRSNRDPVVITSSSTIRNREHQLWILGKNLDISDSLFEAATALVGGLHGDDWMTGSWEHADYCARDEEKEAQSWVERISPLKRSPLGWQPRKKRIHSITCCSGDMAAVNLF